MTTDPEDPYAHGYPTESFTDAELANLNRWHAIIHPARAEAGVYEPNRNPSGCDRFFCLDSANTLPTIAERIFAAGVEEGRRRAGEGVR
jgi:hypothetical protein